MYPYRVAINYRHGKVEEVAGFYQDTDARDFIDNLVKLAPSQGWLTTGTIVLINNQTEQVIYRQTVKGSDDNDIDIDTATL